MASFTDLARTVGANWKTADKETKDYCLAVARIIKERHAELSEAEGVVCLSTIDSISPGPKKETKQRSAESNRMNDYESTESGVICCLPTNQQANDARLRELQSMIPKRASFAFRHQRTNEYPGMCVPTSIGAVAHEQGMTDSHDNNNTSVMQMYQQQYLHNRVTTDSSAKMMWGYGNQMPRQHVIQEMQISIVKGSYDDNSLEFPVISNVSQRAMLSNMMNATHTSKQQIPHREGIRCFGEHRRW